MVEAIPRTPCRDNPAGWDIPSSARDRADKYRIEAQARKAVAACDDLCPLAQYTACRSAARFRPPEHDCVQGGLIWHGRENRHHRRTVPVPLAEFAVRVRGSADETVAA